MSKYLIIRQDEQVPLSTEDFSDSPFICVSTINDIKNTIKHIHTEDKLIDETLSINWANLTVAFAVVDAHVDFDSDEEEAAQVWHHWKLVRILSIREI